MSYSEEIQQLNQDKEVILEIMKTKSPISISGLVDEASSQINRDRTVAAMNSLLNGKDVLLDGHGGLVIMEP